MSMDVGFSRRRPTRPETSPDRAKVCMQPRIKPTKKVQVVYYLSRNGHLEHPHYMEITHLANHALRLRDVMDRLTALRGKGMPSLYSWSCKRSYKNGYVWNDLAENDIIYPAEGAEYVLKGSELVEGCSERLDQLQISHQIQDSNFGSKRRSSPLALVTPIPHRQVVHDQEAAENPNKYEDHQDYDEQEEEEEELVDYEDEKTSYDTTSSTTPHSRCSRGVSTDELEDPPLPPPPQQQTHKTPSAELTHTESSPPSNQSNNVSKRFEDSDPNAVSKSPSSAAGQSRNSVLLQLIACGSSAVGKAKSASPPPCVKQTVAVKRMSCSSHESFRKEVVYRTAMKVAEDEEMIKYMSENPRFGNLQAEDKEYFSGSIVDSMKEEDRVSAADQQPVLKRSNSYNEERSTKAGLAETVEEENREKAAVKGKCIPRRLSCATSKQSRK